MLPLPIKTFFLEDIDIIHCCTPNYLHKDLSIDALEAGKHIYCDKPLAMNIEEARKILKAAEKSNFVQKLVDKELFT